MQRDGSPFAEYSHGEVTALALPQPRRSVSRILAVYGALQPVYHSNFNSPDGESICGYQILPIRVTCAIFGAARGCIVAASNHSLVFLVCSLQFHPLLCQGRPLHVRNRPLVPVPSRCLRVSLVFLRCLQHRRWTLSTKRLFSFVQT